MLGSKVGHAKFVNSPEEVDEENGKFLLVPQDELSKFLQSPKTAAIFFNVYCLPFFKKHSEDDCKKMLIDPKSVDFKLEEDSLWLSKKLSGTSEEEETLT